MAVERTTGRGERNRTSQRKRKPVADNGGAFFDISLLFVVLILMGFGLVMIYSASSYNAFQDYKGDAAHFLKKQLQAEVLGLFVMAFLAWFPYQFWKKFAWPGVIVSALLILAVKTSLGVDSHGATRWIQIPGIEITVQPAEIAKLAVILLAAVQICAMGKEIKTILGMLKVMAVPLILAAEIYFLTKNLSSAVIVVGIAAVMIFVANPNWKIFGAIAAAGSAIVYLLVSYIIKTGAEGKGFRSERILAWLDPEAQAQGKGFQTIQALYAIGSGGFWGKGLGQSMQKLTYLPEAQNDMIFSVICEELGLFGAGLVIVLFIVLLWRMYKDAYNSADLFGTMLVVGVMAHIAIQAVLNIAVVTNTIPNTGISLPFISYGGSSAIFLMAEIALVLNVARGNHGE